MQINTVTQQATKPNPEKPKPIFHHCKIQTTIKTNVINSRRRETKMTTTKIAPETTIIVIITVVKQNLSSTTTKASVMATLTVQTTEMTENQEVSTHLERPLAKRTTLQRIAILEPRQKTDHLFGLKDRWNKVKLNNETHRSIQLKVSRLRPKLKSNKGTSSFRNSI